MMNFLKLCIFDIMKYFLKLWRTFWRHTVPFDVHTGEGFARFGILWILVIPAIMIADVQNKVISVASLQCTMWRQNVKVNYRQLKAGIFLSRNALILLFGEILSRSGGRFGCPKITFYDIFQQFSPTVQLLFQRCDMSLFYPPSLVIHVICPFYGTNLWYVLLLCLIILPSGRF